MGKGEEVPRWGGLVGAVSVAAPGAVLELLTDPGQAVGGLLVMLPLSLHRRSVFIHPGGPAQAGLCLTVQAVAAISSHRFGGLSHGPVPHSSGNLRHIKVLLSRPRSMQEPSTSQLPPGPSGSRQRPTH